MGPPRTKNHKPLFSGCVSPQLNQQLAEKLKNTIPVPLPHEKAVLLFFSQARSKEQRDAVKGVDHAVETIKHASESCTAFPSSSDSDGENTVRGKFKDHDHNMVVLLVKGNREFIRGMELFESLIQEGKLRGCEVWAQEVRGLKDACNEWEAVYPDGEWFTCFEKMAEIDGRLVVLWEAIKKDIWKLWKEYEENWRNGEDGYDKPGEEHADESMEYISPSRIVVKAGQQGGFMTPIVSPTTTPVTATVVLTPEEIFSKPPKPTKTSNIPVIPPAAEPKFPLLAEAIKASKSATTTVLPLAQHPTQAQASPEPARTVSTVGRKFRISSQPSMTTQTTPTPTLASSAPTPYTIVSQPPEQSSTLQAIPAPVLGASAPWTFDYRFSPTLTQLSNSDLTDLTKKPWTPPHTPIIDPINGRDISKPRDIKTPSTLLALTRTAEYIKESVQTLHTAIYGAIPENEPPTQATNTGLLLMINCVGEWTSDIRNQTTAFNTKFDTFTERFKAMDQKLIFFACETAIKVAELSEATVKKEQKENETLLEIKELLLKNQKEIEDMARFQTISFAALTQQNKSFRDGLDEAMELMRASNEEVKNLRAKNQDFKRQIEKLTSKAELLDNHQLGLDIAKENGEENGLMELLWPQGWEGVRKRDTARGVLADEPGFRTLQSVPSIGYGRGKPRGGWCSVM